MFRRTIIGMLLTLAPIAAIVIVDAERAGGAAPKWSISTTPNPPGARSVALQGVSCTSTTHCVAVGYSSPTPTTSKVLIERWDGHNWRMMAAPNKSSSHDMLNDVTCLGPTNCFAVGQFQAADTTFQPLVEHWDGKRWAIMPTPNLDATDSTLSGIACPLANRCFAVGFHGKVNNSHALIEQWDGKRWRVVASRTSPAASAGLSDVECPAANRCFAVGGSHLDLSSKPLVERWNGRIWQPVAAPKAPGTFENLSGLSCTSTTNCAAVGTQFEGSALSTFAERWNGTRWQVVSSPNVPGAERRSNGLNGVSCTSATSCFAVGSRSTTGRPQTLVEQWNGSKWLITASPNVRGEQSQLNDVACPIPAKCFAVGGAKKTLVERYF